MDSEYAAWLNEEDRPSYERRDILAVTLTKTPPPPPHQPDAFRRLLQLVVPEARPSRDDRTPARGERGRR